jgi:TolA-binding protein
MARSALFLPVAAAVFFVVSSPISALAQSGLQTEQRLDDLSDQMRQLTGRIEELTNQVTQLKSQLDRQASDNDVRFQQLGGGGALNTAAPPSQPGTATAELPPQPKPPQGAGADPSQPPSRSGNLGTLAAPGGRQQQQEAPPQQTAAAGGALPAGHPQEQFKYA